jgi:hypothetical protein
MMPEAMAEIGALRGEPGKCKRFEINAKTKSGEDAPSPI